MNRLARFFSVAFLVTLLLIHSAVMAQTATPPQAPPEPPTLVLPEAITSTAVAYPAGAKGNAEVVLVLIIAVDGTVRRAEVAEGHEPFAMAARKASTTWRFRPATRGGKPIVAKIRFAVAFTESEAPASPKEDEPTLVPDAYDPPAPPPGSAPPPPPPEVIDVRVDGERVLPPSVSSLKRAEVRLLPGAFGDPFKAIEILPGITPIVSGLPFFYLRGSPPGNIGYFLDGVSVPYLFHAAAGPSVVHPAIVQQVDLFAGGYPARLGRFSGGIVSADTTDPRTDWHGEAVLRLLDVGALVEGGFADDKLSVLLGGRYSYTAGLFSLISPEITLDYRDFQARVAYEINDDHRVSVVAFGAYDFLSSTQILEIGDGETIERENVIFGAEFYRVDARYDVRLPNGGNLRAAATFGWDRTRLDEQRSADRFLGRLRVRVSQPLSDKFVIRGGVDSQISDYETSILGGDFNEDFGEEFDDLFPARTDLAASAWVDMTWRPNAIFEITPGVRLDTYDSERQTAAAVDPRLSVVAKVHPSVRLLHSFGIANQTPSFIVPIPGVAVASLAGGLQRAVQASMGVEVLLPAKVTATVTGYMAANFNTTDALGTIADPSEEAPRTMGGSKGIEIYLRRSLTERLGGFISYTFSRTTRTFGLTKQLANFDRPHVLHTALGYRIGRGWQAGMRFSLYSGGPIQPSRFGFDDPEQRMVESSRDPAFYRLDFRLEKRWKILGGRGWLSVVLEMINTTLNPETIAGQPIGPVALPSIGLEGGF